MTEPSNNLPILYQNTMAGLSESAGILYLKLIDVFQSEKKAFVAACRYENQRGEVLDYILHNMPQARPDQRTISDLSRFFAERWRHNFMERQS